jgi:hypothetical protein
MALPYLPATEIAPMFNQLEKPDTTTRLQSFLSSIFPKDGLKDQLGHHPAGVFL